MSGGRGLDRSAIFTPLYTHFSSFLSIWTVQPPDWQVPGLVGVGTEGGPRRGFAPRGGEINVQLISVLSEQQLLEPGDEICRRPVAVELSKPWIS